MIFFGRFPETSYSAAGRYRKERGAAAAQQTEHGSTSTSLESTECQHPPVHGDRIQARPTNWAVTSSLSVRDCETLPYFKDHCRRISALLSSEQTSTLARSSMLVSTRLAAARDLPMEVNCTQHGRQAVWPANGSYEYIVHLSIRPKSWGPVASMACVAGMKGTTKTSLACRTCAGLATTDSQEETGKEYR